MSERFIEKAPESMFNFDASILNAREFRFIGATPEPQMMENPDIPLYVLERIAQGVSEDEKRQTIESVNETRRQRREIASHTAGLDFEGIDFPEDEAPVILLSELDIETGRVLEGSLKVTGVLYETAGVIDRDPKLLKKVCLREEEKQRYFYKADGDFKKEGEA